MDVKKEVISIKLSKQKTKFHESKIALEHVNKEADLSGIGEDSEYSGNNIYGGRNQVKHQSRSFLPTLVREDVFNYNEDRNTQIVSQAQSIGNRGDLGKLGSYIDVKVVEKQLCYDEFEVIEKNDDDVLANGANSITESQHLRKTRFSEF